MALPERPKFRELRFGLLDASEEAADEPLLLRDGYYDYREAAYGTAQGKVWVLLGPKGSGKSAVLEHIRLKWEDRWDRFFTYWNLASFPVSDVTQISAGFSPGASRATASWEFLFWLRIAESLSRDEGLSASSSFTTMVKNLRKGGFIEGDWLSKVSSWTTGHLKLNLGIVQAAGEMGNAAQSPLDMSAYIRTQILSTSTNSRHIIALDGLDSFFFESSDRWASLAGLLAALWNINRELSAAKLPISLLIAARSDIVDVLPGPELNKLKEHALYLDWHANGIGAQNHLWKLIDAKTSVAHANTGSILKQYLDTRIAIGPYVDLPPYFLDHTRLLPRDLVALLKIAQLEYKGNKALPEKNAKTAVERYCEEYFVGEIFDNLAGILPAHKARQLESFKDALRSAPARFFDFGYLKEELDGELEASEIKDLLKQMFTVGGIGIKNGRYTDFVFRRTSGGAFSTRYEFVLHDALTRAWNRKWSSRY